MSEISKSLGLIKYMLKEEFRMQSAIIGKVQFLFFPVIIAIFALIFSISSVLILSIMPLDRIYFILHLLILAYGLGVGGFALFAGQIGERRFGQMDLLLATPTTHPLSFKSTFLAFYIKDTIYYMLFSIIPLVLGMALSIPFTGFRLTSVLFLLFTLSLTFLLGISFSFFVSTMWVRAKVLGAIIILAVAALVLYNLATSIFNLKDYIITLQYQYTGDPLYLGITILLILAFSFVAVNFIKVRFGKKSERYRPEVIRSRQNFDFAKGYSSFLAKEWVDMRRAGTLFPIAMAYVGPLLFLLLIIWILKTLLVIPIDFNIVFYASMMGLFSVTIYSWLNMPDTHEFYQLLPVNVPQLIRTKLILFALLTYGMTAAFLVVVGAISSGLDLLPLALLVGFVLTTYTVVATAYLTGLRTNSYLFDPRVLAKFTGLIAPPLILVIIASLRLSDAFAPSSIFIVIVCAALALVMAFLYSRIERRWAKEGFAL